MVPQTPRGRRVSTGSPIPPDLARDLQAHMRKFTINRTSRRPEFCLGFNRLAAVSGTVSALADVLPDTPLTWRKGATGVILVKMDDDEDKVLEHSMVPNSVRFPDDEADVWVASGNLTVDVDSGVSTLGPIVERDTALGCAVSQALRDNNENAHRQARMQAAQREEDAARREKYRRLSDGAKEALERERVAAEVQAFHNGAEDTGSTGKDGRDLLPGEVDLTDVFTGDLRREHPTVFPITDGHMFYRKRTHTVIGQGGSGKSTLMQAAVVATLHADPAARVAYLDYEDTSHGVGMRLRAMGMVDADRTRFHYLESPSLKQVTALCEAGPLTLVVIDGVQEALTSAKISVNDYIRWHRAVPDALARATDAAVVTIDHMAFNGTHPIGSVAKYNALSATAFRLDGKGNIYLSGVDRPKDRPGGLWPLTGPRDLLAKMTVTDNGETTDVTVDLVNNSADTGGAAEDADDTAAGAGLDDETAGEPGELDAWLMASPDRKLRPSDLVAIAVHLNDAHDGKPLAPGRVLEAVRNLAPRRYAQTKPNRWEKGRAAAHRAGYITHPAETFVNYWIAGETPLTEVAAEALRALQDTAEDLE